MIWPCMVTAKTQYNLANARILRGTSLRRRLLRRGQRVSGGVAWAQKRLVWLVGQSVRMISSPVRESAPATGETLPQRLNTTGLMVTTKRSEPEDFLRLHLFPPKSVSLAGFSASDDAVCWKPFAGGEIGTARVRRAFASTRIRCWQRAFRPAHREILPPRCSPTTPRALDPHLPHCIVFATFDPSENRWKRSKLRTAARPQVRRERLLS